MGGCQGCRSVIKTRLLTGTRRTLPYRKYHSYYVSKISKIEYFFGTLIVTGVVWYSQKGPSGTRKRMLYNSSRADHSYRSTGLGTYQSNNWLATTVAGEVYSVATVGLCGAHQSLHYSPVITPQSWPPLLLQPPAEQHNIITHSVDRYIITTHLSHDQT